MVKTNSERQREYIKRLRESGGIVFKVTMDADVTRKLEILQRAFPDTSKSRLVELAVDAMYDKVEPVLKKQFPDIVSKS